jgi:DNA-binding transcriptional regulator YiaG
MKRKTAKAKPRARAVRKPVRIAPGARRRAGLAAEEALASAKARRDDSLSVAEVRAGFGISRETFGRLTGFSVRALAGWEGGERKPGPQARRRLAELARLLDALSGIVRRDAIPPWMATPNASLGGLKPIEIIERGQIDRLWRMVYEVEAGSPV